MGLVVLHWDRLPLFLHLQLFQEIPIDFRQPFLTLLRQVSVRRLRSPALRHRHILYFLGLLEPSQCHIGVSLDTTKVPVSILRCEACLDGAEDFDEVMRLKDH